MAVITANGKRPAMAVASLLSGDADLDAMVGYLLILVDRDDEPGGRTGRVLRTAGRDLDAELAAIPGFLDRVVWSCYSISDERELADRVQAVREMAHLLRSVREAASSVATPIQPRRLHKALLRLVGNWDRVIDQLGLGPEDAPNFKGQLLASHERTTDISQCQGHDIHLAVSMGAKKFGRDHVQAMFMVALTEEQFRQSPTGLALQEWAEEHRLCIWRTEHALPVAS